MSKKIKSIICCVCASLVLIVALCLPFAFKLNTNSTNYASADEVSGDYAFSGSNLVFVYASTQGLNPLLSSTALTNYVGYVSFSFTQSSVNYKATTSLNNAGFPFSYNGLINNPSRVTEHWSPSTSLSFFEHVVNCTDSGTYSSLFIRVGIDFNCNVVGAYLSQYVAQPGYFLSQNGASTRNLLVSYVRYFGVDSDGNYDTTNFIEFATISNYNLFNSDSRLQSRTYYFQVADTDSAQYGAGYNDGYSVGTVTGETSGYNAGYTAGDSVGYTRGYNAGVNATNTYSFTNLISAVLDAPINAFTSLFNFEILGVNLSSFLLALFTICVVLTVIKFIF